MKTKCKPYLGVVWLTLNLNNVINDSGVICVLFLYVIKLIYTAGARVLVHVT